MSRLKENYENSRYRRFMRWMNGEVDLLDGVTDVRIPEETEPAPAGHGAAGPVSSADKRRAALEARRKESEEIFGPEIWPQAASGEPIFDRRLTVFRGVYSVMSVILCAVIIWVFLWTTVHLPPFGGADNPANNEVPRRYIESGLAETGAVNFVTGMILDYRAFDTFGESCVLFIASCCVLVLLRIDPVDEHSRARVRKQQENDRVFEPKNDVILQKAAFILVPLILIFGIYIVLNGHLSPGGGFSGGAVLGSGLILYLNAFGFQKTERFFTEKVYRRVTLCALTFYCLAKSYSFFTGANHLESGIPLGTPGAILSSGLILPLNICVGLVVMCTMYAFYTLFRKGGM